MVVFEALGPIIFVSTIALGAFVLNQRRKYQRSCEEEKELFWNREAQADNVRKKDLTFLNYIIIPIESLPFFDSDDEQIKEYMELIKNLSTQRILNLSGLSNTDLKLKYGAANLPLLTEYDENYILLVNTLSKLGEKLLEAGHRSEALAFLEYSLTIKTDVSSCYYMLVNEYRRMGRPEEIDRLIEAAGRTSSIMTPIILKKLTAMKDESN